MKRIAIEVFDPGIEQRYYGTEGRLILKDHDLLTVNELVGVAAQLEDVAHQFKARAKEITKMMQRG